MRTFSGSETIMWQSMKIPGTPLDTHERMGAPWRTGSMRDGNRCEWRRVPTHGYVGHEMASGHDISFDMHMRIVGALFIYPSMTSAEHGE